MESRCIIVNNESSSKIRKNPDIYILTYSLSINMIIELGTIAYILVTASAATIASKTITPQKKVLNSDPAP
jgi:hypothetical protein